MDRVNVIIVSLKDRKRKRAFHLLLVVFFIFVGEVCLKEEGEGASPLKRVRTAAFVYKLGRFNEPPTPKAPL